MSDRRQVVVEVRDKSVGTPILKQPESDEEAGRGLRAAAALCEHWGWKRVPGWGGTVVWAELYVFDRST